MLIDWKYVNVLKCPLGRTPEPSLRQLALFFRACAIVWLPASI